MVNSVAVERQAISRRGERESSGGGKKERKGIEERSFKGGSKEIVCADFNLRILLRYLNNTWYDFA